MDAWRWVLPQPTNSTELAEVSASKQVYPSPIKQIQATYVVGGNWTWIRIGAEPIPTADGTGRLEGNYGVVYRIGVQLRNPFAEPKKVEVAFDAGAGPANAVFLIGGQYVDMVGAYAGGERNVAQFQLSPNETRNVTIETMPLGGSFYPAALVVR